MKKTCLALGSLFFCALPLLGATPDNDDGNTRSISDTTITNADNIFAGYGRQTANDNHILIESSSVAGSSSPLFNAHVVGGWAVYQTANNNSVEIIDSTVNRNISGGQATYGTQANYNTVSISGSHINEGASLQAVPTLTDYQAEHRLTASGNDEYVLSSLMTDSVQSAGDIDPESSNFTVYGGVVGNGEAAGNKIIISNNTDPIGNNLVAGYSPYLAETSLHDNLIQITNSKVTGLIAGAASLGASYDVTVKKPLLNNNNSVSVLNSQINDAIGAYGGFSTNGNSILLVNSSAHNLYGVSFGQNIFYSGAQPDVIENTADNNSVSLYNSSNVSGNIYGAQSHSVQARGNQITIAGGSSTNGSLYGAHISNARVQLNDSTVVWNTVQTAAENNTISLSGATVGNASAQIAGAQNFSGWANQNAVEMTDSTVTANTLAGGWAEHERQTLTTGGQQDLSIGYQADQNAVTAAGSTLTTNVYGGLVSFVENINPAGEEDLTPSSASGNFVHLDTSSITGDVYGGAAQGNYTAADNNRVWLTQAQVTGSVYGGFAEGTDSQSLQNEVILQNTSVSGDVFASSATMGGGNTVTLAGQTDIGGTVFAGNGTNNQLTLLNFQSNNPLNVSGFDNPYLISGADTSVTFAQSVDKAEVYVQGIEDVNGHVMIRTPNPDSVFNLHSVDSGVYTYSLSPVQDGSWTDWVLSGGFSAPRAKTYAQTSLVGLALANAGEGLLQEALQTARREGKETGTFFQAGYEQATHQTGSSFRLHATTALAGLYTQNETLAGGFYARYAYGTYHTEPVYAKSDASSWAGGVFGAWQPADALSLSADARVGWQRVGYGGSLETGADFDYESVFTSLQAGIQYALPSGLQAQARLRWTHLPGESLTDNLGEQIYLSGSDSLLATVGLSWRAEQWSFGGFTPQAKAEVLHEFNGKGLAEVENHRVEGLSLRGTTGRLTAGLSYQALEGRMLAALSGFAQGGQMDGWGIELKGNWRF